MFYDDTIKSYGDVNYEINKIYCEKYGLHISVSNQRKLQNRHSAWERIPLLLENIENFDYLIWIDADAFFYIDADNIVNVIQKNTSAHFIFSYDIGNKNINSGVFIVKNSQYSIQFLKRWLYDEELYAKNPVPLWLDQGVLIDMFEKNIFNIRHNCVVLEYGIIQHFYEHDKLRNTYVLHVAGRDEKSRYEISTKYLHKIVASLKC
jgi:hypothetical protein